MADQPASGTPDALTGSGVPVVDLTTLVGEAYMQADLLRGDALALELEEERARPRAVARMRHAAAHLEQLAAALDGTTRPRGL